MGNKKLPEIRLEGFSGEWELRQLNELVTPIVREVPKPDTAYKRISIRSHSKGTFRQTVDDPKSVAMEKLYVVKENDLVVNITFAWEHAIAVASKADDGLLVSHRFPTFLIDKSDINFIRYLVTQESFRRKMERISPGGAGRNRVLNKKDFMNLKVFVPSEIDEQNRIGNLIKQLDEIISYNQQELDTLKQTKQGFLQKMFPKKGESVPEIRFPKFTGDWIERNLGEVASGFEYGLNANAVEYDGENKYLRITDIDDQTREFIKDNLRSPNIDFTNADDYLLKEGDILFARTGASVGKSYIYEKREGKTYFAGFLIRIRIKKGYYPDFIFQNTFTSKYNNYIRVTSQRSGQPGVNAQEYAKFPMMIPSFEEQQKIGKFFKRIDSLITLQQQELETLKQTKKAFLQKMFV